MFSTGTHPLTSSFPIPYARILELLADDPTREPAEHSARGAGGAGGGVRWAGVTSAHEETPGVGFGHRLPRWLAAYPWLDHNFRSRPLGPCRLYNLRSYVVP